MQEQYYIVRGSQSGVYFGKIKEKNGANVVMENARMLWYWDGAASVMQIAAEGVKRPKECKFTMAVNEIEIIDAIATIPCTPEAVNIIKDVKEWKR